ncbi:MAG: T9SS type A sorting domain-containing protein [Aureispira sp.]
MRTTTTGCLFGFLLFFISFSNTLQAVSGAEFAYECLGQNQYRITLQVYRGCTKAALPTTQTIDFNSISCGTTFSTTMNLEQSYEVSGIHSSQIGNSTCNGGTLPGFERYVYVDTIVFPQTCADWIVSWTGCCRNPDFTNLSIAGSSIYVEAGIDSRFLYSSPQFDQPQLGYHCANSNSNGLLHGPHTYPSNMDSFVSTLTCPLQSANNCLSYVTGLSTNMPFLLAPSSSIVVDNIRRKVFFDAANNINQLAAVAMTIYQIKNGDTVGYVQTDFPVVIDSQNIYNNNSIQIKDPLYTTGALINLQKRYNPVLCAGEVLIFSFIAHDPDGDTIHIDPINTNLNQVFGPGNVTILLNSISPFRPDSVQCFIQIIPPSNNLAYDPLKSQWGQHFRVALTDETTLYPSYVNLDMNFNLWSIQHLKVPQICPYASYSLQLETMLETPTSLLAPVTSWTQLSGPPVYFSDTSIHNPIIITTPSIHGDSIVLGVSAVTPIDSLTGNLCFLRSKLVLHYDSSGSCSAPFPNQVIGSIRVDTNQNCLPDISETRWPFYSILLFKKGIDSFYYVAPSTANYEAYLDTGTYMVSVNQFNTSPYWSTCSPNQWITIDTAINPQQLDWAVEPSSLCPKMEVDISASPMRACQGRFVRINYQNTGTIAAHNTYIEVTLDSFLTVLSSTIPISSQVGNVYRFDLDTVPFNSFGSIALMVTTDCSIPVNTPYTITAHVYPDSLCLSSIPNLVIQDSCDLDTAYFQVTNYADAHTIPLEYWIIEDQVVVDTGTLQLGQGQSLQISYPMTAYKTYQLVVNPSASDYAASYIVNCTGDSLYSPILFTPNHQLDYVATLYRGTVGSYDPNIKVAEPEGYGTNHYFSPNTPIDYTVHFQNTGTDTAYQVVILDTLSNHLNIGTLTMQGGSHPYTWRLLPSNLLGYVVLEVTFDNILLVDSITNEPASHGFIHYSIQQKPNLSNFTRIENSASIYFDLNAPIKTNTAFHTICDNCYPLMITDNSTVITTNNIATTDLGVKVYPNPVTGYQLTIEQATAEPCEIELFTLRGILLKSRQMNQPIMSIDMQNLAIGAYFLRVTRANSSSVFKIIRQ